MIVNGRCLLFKNLPANCSDNVIKKVILLVREFIFWVVQVIKVIVAIAVSLFVIC